jgi:hypothetical protein
MMRAWRLALWAIALMGCGGTVSTGYVEPQPIVTDAGATDGADAAPCDPYTTAPGRIWDCRKPRGAPSCTGPYDQPGSCKPQCEQYANGPIFDMCAAEGLFERATPDAGAISDACERDGTPGVDFIWFYDRQIGNYAWRGLGLVGCAHTTGTFNDYTVACCP